MKHSKWKLISSLKYQLYISIMYYVIMLMVFIVLMLIILDVAEAIERGRNVLRVLDGKWFEIIFILIATVIYSWVYFTSASGYFGDILFERVKELPVVEAGQMSRGYTIVGLRTLLGHEVKVKQSGSKPITLRMIEKIEKIPEGDSFKILYLKRSKVIVGVEVLSGARKDEKKLKMLREPITSQYDKEVLAEVTENHKCRLKIVMMYCVIGIVALVGWGIYSASDFIYWYRFETTRCAIGWIVLILLNVAQFIWFLCVDRGCLRELKRKEICVTEVISTSDLYCSRLLFGIMGKVVGLEVKVKMEDGSEEEFLLYKGASEYWNCLPILFERVYEPSVLRRFTEGEHSLDAVRFHYLKNSRVIVKMDV